jgi:hypothetical protein
VSAVPATPTLGTDLLVDRLKPLVMAVAPVRLRHNHGLREDRVRCKEGLNVVRSEAQHGHVQLALEAGQPGQE